MEGGTPGTKTRSRAGGLCIFMSIAFLLLGIRILFLQTFMHAHHSGLRLYPLPQLEIAADCDYVRRQLTADRYKHMSLFNGSVQYKFKQAVLRLELDNLLNQRSYAYTLFDGINTYSYDYGLCGRTAMLKLTFKL